MYQITTLYILNLQNVTYQVYLNKTYIQLAPWALHAQIQPAAFQKFQKVPKSNYVHSIYIVFTTIFIAFILY